MNVGEILDRLGGITEVAHGLGLPVSTVGSWKARGSIPSRKWRHLLALAERKAISGVTLETLERAHAEEATQCA